MNSNFENQQYYTQGNTARKLNTVPVREERPERVKREHRQESERIIKNRKRAKAFDLRYTVMLTFATVVLFTSCIYMLSVQEKITEQRREIAALEKNLNELTDNNNETNKRLESSVNLPEIYKVATTELGMVYPKAGQILSYKASNPDYVKQFKDVPTN